MATFLDPDLNYHTPDPVSSLTLKKENPRLSAQQLRDKFIWKASSNRFVLRHGVAGQGLIREASRMVSGEDPDVESRVVAKTPGKKRKAESAVASLTSLVEPPTKKKVRIPTPLGSPDESPAPLRFTTSVDEQEYITARRNFNANVSSMLTNGDHCDMTKFFAEGSVQVLSSNEKDSSSPTCIVFADISVPSGSPLREHINPKYFDAKMYPGFTGVALKVFIQEDVFDNSLDIEVSMYKNITVDLLTRSNTPHLVSYLTSLKCTFSQLQLSMKSPKEDTAKILNSLNYDDKDDWDASSVEQHGGVELTLLVSERATTSAKGRNSFNDLLLNNIVGSKHYKKDTKIQGPSPLTEKDVIQIFFQIIQVLCCFEREGIQHNDLHLGNVFVERYFGDVHQFVYREILNDNLIALNTEWNAKLFDFDRSTIYSPAMKRNMLMDKAFLCGVCTKDIYNPKETINTAFAQRIRHENGYGACNKWNPAYDIHGVMSYFLSTDVEDAPAVRKMREFIREQIPPEVLAYNVKTNWGGSSPQLCWDQYVDAMVRDLKLHMKTPTDYMQAFLDRFAKPEVDSQGRPIANSYGFTRVKNSAKLDPRLGFKLPRFTKIMLDSPSQPSEKIVDVPEMSSESLHPTERFHGANQNVTSMKDRVGHIINLFSRKVFNHPAPDYASKDPEWAVVAQLPTPFPLQRYDPRRPNTVEENALRRTEAIERVSDWVYLQPHRGNYEMLRTGPKTFETGEAIKDQFIMAEAELNVDLTIAPWTVKVANPVNKKKLPPIKKFHTEFVNLMTQWINEVTLLSNDNMLEHKWSYDSTRRKLYNDYEKRVEGVSIDVDSRKAVQLAKVCCIVACPIFYGLPTIWRNRVLHQMGMEEYHIYQQMFANSVPDQVILPLLYSSA